MSEPIYIGSGARVRARFRDPDTRVPVDVEEPVHFTVKPPTGPNLEGNGARISTGVYEYEFVPPVSGRYGYRVESAGTLPGVSEDQFDVVESTLA